MIGHLIVLLYFFALVSGIPALIYATQIKNVYSVADLICMGLGNIEIADALGTQTQSVANTVSALIRRAGAKSRSELIRMLSGA